MTQQLIDIPAQTVATLIAQNTLAGAAVEADRVDGITPADMPLLLVFYSEEGQGASAAGGPPAFDMTMTLAVQALVQHAIKEDAVAALNSLLLQVQLALLEDPVWNRMASEISSMRVTRSFSRGESVVIGDGRIEFLLTWRENYETRLGPRLSGVTARIDTGSPFNALGDFANVEFPAAPPPRTHGPDGNIEVTIKIDFPPV